MRTTLKMPTMGETTTEVLVVEWLVDLGQPVDEGDALLTVETDKVEVEVPAPIAGTLVQRLAEKEDEVAVGAPFAVLES